MELVFLYGLMENAIWGTTKMIRNTDRECLSGKMVQSMKENGKMGSRVDMAFIHQNSEKRELGTGRKEKEFKQSILSLTNGLY